MIFSKKYRISIDKPCQEKWESMAPMEKGRFCDSCSKNVIDFSVMSEREIVSFFKNKPLNTCGRFTKEQVAKTYIQKAELKLPFHQRFFSFLLSLFVSNSFISKANAQSDIVQVIQNDSLEKLVKTDTSLTDTSCVAELNPLPSDSIAEELVWTIDSTSLWAMEHQTYKIVSSEQVVVMVMGAIAWNPPPPDPPDFLEKCLASIGIVLNGRAVKAKEREAISQNDNSLPKKEPVKKEPVISVAVLPEELKRKSEREL